MNVNYVQFMKDWHLMIITLIFLGVDVTILIVTSAIDNARFMVASIPDREHPGEFSDVSDDWMQTITACLYMHAHYIYDIFICMHACMHILSLYRRMDIPSHIQCASVIPTLRHIG